MFWAIPDVLGHSRCSSRPFWLTLVVAVLVQHFLAHSQFLEQHSLQKEITNRRALFIVTFLLFPTNVLVGVMAAVWRVVISGFYNAIHFCRMDISLLHRGVETFDPGGTARGHRATSGVLVPPWEGWDGGPNQLGLKVTPNIGNGTPGAGGFS
ncbi:hypothetical protein DV515_00018089 [Chloebia gouldiae]|uniref:Receptor for retinol uptake STRA6 n=1 Tax=Chloebia gouldiae TaxID=44316 RepID=A0A3L8Q8H7_CHLGU|nr:hypothetical protein DV515_00018089 [Chloebia gouldiae]